MKKRLWFVFMCLLSLCACKTTKNNTEYIFAPSSEYVPIDPHVPTSAISPEARNENLKKSISTLLSLYNKMENWKETDSDFTKGMDKLKKVESTYGERISEIASVTVTDLSEEELLSLSEDIRTIVSAIREVNDMFEFR